MANDGHRPVVHGSLKVVGYKHLLKLATGAARSAGEYIRGVGRGKAHVERDLRHDLKLDVDRVSEERIIGILRAKTPYPILSEEWGRIVGDASRKSEDYCWIIDPLDGSVNFALGIPLACVSIGLWRNGAPLLGVIYDLEHGQLYSGCVGVGAWVDGRVMRVRPPRPNRDAILCTGFPAGGSFQRAEIMRFVRCVQAFKKVRLLGSAALSLAYVAAGVVDCYVEKDIKIWDVAAGLALVMAAGGDVVCEGFPSIDTVLAIAGSRTATRYLGRLRV